MLKSKITRENLEDIGIEFLLENKCQPYAEGVNSAWDMFNSVVETEDAELKILRELVQSYSNKEKAPNNAADLFEKGIIDFYQFVLNYDDKIGDLQKENEDLKKQVEFLKERIKFWEKRYQALEDQYLSAVKSLIRGKK